jgi:hypothetical protein
VHTVTILCTVSTYYGVEWPMLHKKGTELFVDVHMECAYQKQPEVYCHDHHFRSKTYYFNVVRIHGATKQEEVYTGVRSFTEFDKGGRLLMWLLLFLAHGPPPPFCSSL